MAYFVAYGSISTTDLFDPSTYFNSNVQDIGTQHEYRSHISDESLDVVGLGMNDPNSATVQSISLFTGSGISGPSSEQTLSWQATGLSAAYNSLFNAAFIPEQFGKALLAGDDTLQGSADVDSLYAFGGNDIILGAGGADVIDGGVGNDTITGGSGNDQFFFTSSLKAANADHITDFNSGHDEIILLGDIFKSLPGDVKPGNFVIGTAPIDKNDFIIYDPTTGVLSYDSDGSRNHHHMIAFATLDGHPTLVASDFSVIV